MGANVLSPDKIAALLARDKPVSAVGSDTGDMREGGENHPPSNLTWCDFCKGHYNEYHYGEPEDD